MTFVLEGLLKMYLFFLLTEGSRFCDTFFPFSLEYGWNLELIPLKTVFEEEKKFSFCRKMPLCWKGQNCLLWFLLTMIWVELVLAEKTGR